MINRFSLKERLDHYVEVIESSAKKLKLDYKIEINSDEESTEDILKKYKKTSHIIYAVGGDGILNRVLNSIYGTKNKIGCIPAGTGNDFNRSINDYFKDGDNVVDVIKCNNKYFVNVACFGVDADIANDNTVVHNKLIPRSMQYKVGVAKHILLYKPYNFTMKWDKETFTSDLSLVTVCNGGYYGGGFHVNPDGIYNDGKLDIFIITATNRIQLIKYLVSLLKGKHKECKYVKHVVTDNFKIITEQEIDGNLDGESLLSKKFEMNVIPNSMTFYNNKKLIRTIDKELKK
jgi:YegS/Rv2252/BmrU family lipid kinase